MGHKKIPIIYCIENKINKKKYIGLCSYYTKRLSEHKLALNNDSHYNSYLQDSWNKYGEENFDFYILRYCNSHEDLDHWENYYIEQYNTTNNSFGYNLNSGGRSNFQLSNETKEKIRKSHIGKFHTEESKRKISENNFWRGRNGKLASQYGTRCSEETKEILRRKLSRDGSPVFGTKYPNSASQYYGVSIYNQKQKDGSTKTYWKAQLRVDKKQIKIGKYFKNEIDAARAYNEYIVENNLKNPLNNV